MVPLWWPQVHLHSTLSVTVGIVGLLSLQQRLDPLCSPPLAYILLATNWACTTWLSFLLVKSNLLVPVLILPSILISRFIDLDIERQKFFFVSPTSRRFTLQADGATLDAIEIPLGRPTNRWAIWTNANGVLYEQNLVFLRVYGMKLGVNVLTFNYRGVGDSTGWPFNAMDLVKDGTAAVEYLKKTKHIAERNILIHGHSMGGGLLGYLAIKYPELILVSDRSFRSLTTVAKAFMVNLGPTLAVLLGVVMGGCYDLVTRHSRWADQSHFYRNAVIGGAVGFFLGKYTTFMQWFAPTVLKHVGWELVVAKIWPSERTLCMYHPQDEVIHYGHSSLHLGLPPAAGDPVFRSLGLYSHAPPQQMHHMYMLNNEMAEWERVSAAILELIQLYMEPEPAH